MYNVPIGVHYKGLFAIMANTHQFILITSADLCVFSKLYSYTELGGSSIYRLDDTHSIYSHTYSKTKC